MVSNQRLSARLLSTEVITDSEENYWLGDLRSSSGRTIEVKSQPISPSKYTRNFVEFFELSSNPARVDGFMQLAERLQMGELQLAQMRVAGEGGARAFVGYPDYLSVSIRSIMTAEYMIYVNWEHSPQWIYLYMREEIVEAILEAVPKGFRRGAGNSNDDTFAVFIHNAGRCWPRELGRDWEWHGGFSEEEVCEEFRSAMA